MQAGLGAIVSSGNVVQKVCPFVGVMHRQVPASKNGLNVTFEKRKTRSQHEAQGASKKPN